MLSFAGLGRGTAAFSIVALISAWIGSALLDFSQSTGAFFFVQL
jgi:hypothetical protein